MVAEQAQKSAPSRKVVVDAGAVIKQQRLERFGGELYTTGGVLREVKDERARALLQTLPEELRTREPLPQDLAFAKQFAKATGDLGFLSANDLDLIALTVTLQRESGGELRQQPRVLSLKEGSAPFDWAPARIAKPGTGSRNIDAPPSATGEVADAKAAGAEPVTEAGGAEPLLSSSACEAAEAKAGGTEPGNEAGGAEPGVALDAPAGAKSEEQDGAVSAPFRPPERKREDGNDAQQAGDGDASCPTTAATSPEVAPAEAEAPGDDGDSEDGSSGGEWVTAENLHHFRLGVQATGPPEAPDTAVGPVTCATADYSVQNVLLQMGITPLTFDGYAVRSVKLWGLICRACFFFTRDTQKVFCAKCGHDTVVRVPIIVDQDGQASLLNSGRPLRKKGAIYSAPAPQGGRGWKPFFAEDEMLMGGKDRELRHLQNLHEKERQMHDPFNEDNGARSWWQRGTTSTGKQLHGSDMPRVQAGYGRKNPNQNNFKFKGRKKR